MSFHQSSPLQHTPSKDAAAEQAAILRAVAAFQDGEDRETPFRWLFDRFHRPLQRFFSRKGMPPEVCHDLTQEAFVGIYRGLEAYRPEARFETWLYTVANSVYLKAIRARATDKRSGVEVSTADAAERREPALELRDEPLDKVLMEEERQALRDAVESLPEQMRRCLKLRIYHEMSYREIAELLGISIETVKAHLFQARGKLKKALNDAF